MVKKVGAKRIYKCVNKPEKPENAFLTSLPTQMNVGTRVEGGNTSRGMVNDGCVCEKQSGEACRWCQPDEARRGSGEKLRQHNE